MSPANMPIGHMKARTRGRSSSASEAVRTELARRGHPVKTVGDLDGPCSIEIIRRDAASGMLLAGSDPRRDGWALAW
jgi:gamma-glutamyltranspeptidase